MSVAAACTSFRILPVGDSAVSVEFGSVIDEAINEQVVALDSAVREAAVPGIVETIPTYRSLLVVFDPDSISAAEVAALVAALGRRPMARPRRRAAVGPCRSSMAGRMGRISTRSLRCTR